jgi:predicted DNA-binding protein
MTSRKVATTVYITVEQDERLKLLSHVTGTSMAQFIRDGVDLVLSQNQHRLPQQLDLKMSGDDRG